MDHPYTIEVDGHKANPGQVYPGMGGPREWYPACSCNWRGLKVSEWKERGVFLPQTENGRLVLENNLILPSSMDGDQRDALALILDHLQVPVVSLIDRANVRRLELDSQLKGAATESNYKEVEEILELLKREANHIQALNEYLEVERDDEVLALKWIAAANQDAMRKTYEESKARGHYS